MSDNGFILLHRTVFENPFCKNNLKHLGFWIFLLGKASFKECSFYLKNQKIHLNPGQFVTGRKALSKNSSVSEMQIERWLDVLEKEQQIAQQKTNKYRLITIINWKKYQSHVQQNAQQMNNRCTTDEQQMNTINKVNKVNKEIKNKDIYMQVIDGFNTITSRSITLTKDRQHLIGRAFEDGYKAEDILKAFSNRMKAEWWISVKKHLDFESLFYKKDQNGNPKDWIGMFKDGVFEKDPSVMTAEEQIKEQFPGITIRT